MENLLVSIIKINSHSFNKKNLVNLIGVDLQNCSFEIFNGRKYTKKLYGNDLFLFIDSDKTLIGATIGAMYQKSFEDYSATYLVERKNRIGLESESDIIIRIPAAERYYKPRFNKKYDKSLTSTPSLSKRLQNYKQSKIEGITDETVRNMITELFNYTLNSLQDQSRLQIFKNVHSFSISSGSILKALSTLVENYESQLKLLNNEKEYYDYNNQQWNKDKSYVYKNYLDSIIEIKDWHKLIKK